MPKNVLPAAARVLPKAGQKIWMRVFNNSLDEGMADEEASRMAWAAVKRAGYNKGTSGKWSKSMNIKDTEFTLHDDDSFELGVPLTKVDIKRRIVGGFATLNNLDEGGDILDASASVDAFGAWFGNIREMHKMEAVGKAIDWRPETYVDEETGNEYEGIWVEAKISKGAEDTWQKVLDGTLAGFSVGGATQEKERVLVKVGDSNRQAWKITKYRLTELSLVDNPCNKLATLSLIKSVDGGYEVNDAIETEEVEKAYNGETGEFEDLTPLYQGVVTALEALRDGAISVNADDVVGSVSSVLGGFRWTKKYETIVADSHAKEEAVDKADKTVEDTDSLEKAESDIDNEVELTEDEVTVFKKFIKFVTGTKDSTEDLTPIEEEGSNMNEEEVAKAIEVKGEELAKSADEKFDAVADSLVKIEDLLKSVATADVVADLRKELEGSIADLASRVETVEATGAIKKSGDDAGVTSGEKIEKSDDGFWGDSILPAFVKDRK